MRITAEEKRATRQRIVDAALDLFRRQGFEATTTRDIAQAAGTATARGRVPELRRSARRVAWTRPARASAARRARSYWGADRFRVSGRSTAWLFEASVKSGTARCLRDHRETHGGRPDVDRHGASPPQYCDRNAPPSTATAAMRMTSGARS